MLNTEINNNHREIAGNLTYCEDPTPHARPLSCSSFLRLRYFVVKKKFKAFCCFKLWEEKTLLIFGPRLGPRQLISGAVLTSASLWQFGSCVENSEETTIFTFFILRLLHVTGKLPFLNCPDPQHRKSSSLPYQGAKQFLTAALWKS